MHNASTYRLLTKIYRLKSQLLIYEGTFLQLAVINHLTLTSVQLLFFSLSFFLEVSAYVFRKIFEVSNADFFLFFGFRC